MPHADSLVETVLKGSYLVMDRIGSGGFATVYRAMQLTVEREVAVKVMRPELINDPDIRDRLVERFRREAMTTSRLEHPNTVRVIDFGETSDGELFLVLELLHGDVLSDVLRTESPLAPARVAHIGAQICKSLGEAHGKGIVHRDLKPGNIFLCHFEDDYDFIKVMDFGIARLMNMGGSRLTRTGTTQGTPRYMSPEQVQAKETGPPTDFYALGVMIHEMLSGRPPFEADSPVAVGMMHIQKAPPPLDLSWLPADAAAAWSALVDRLLAKDPEERPQAGREVVESLTRLVDLSGEAAAHSSRAAKVAANTMTAGRAAASSPPSASIPPVAPKAMLSGESWTDPAGRLTTPRSALTRPGSPVPLYIGAAALVVVGAWLVRRRPQPASEPA